MKKQFLQFALTVALVCGSAAALAAGVDVQSKFETIWSVMKTCGVIVATIAIAWSAYKILFKGANLGDVSGPLLGGVLLGAAPWIGELLVNGTV